MRLLENHDSDRFLLETPSSLDAYKQAVVLLLTIPGIPQLYYGQELLMTGTTKLIWIYTSGYVGRMERRCTQCFRREWENGYTARSFRFYEKLLHWRKGNDVISKGKMKHFMPRNNIYVYERSYNGKSILVVMNGVNKEVDWDLAHYKEVIGNKTDARNVLTDTDVKLGAIIRLQPKEVLMLEL